MHVSLTDRNFTKSVTCMFFWHMWDSNISQCPHNTSHTSCLVNCPPYSGPRVTVSSPARRDVAEGECGVKRRLFLNSYLGASRLVFFYERLGKRLSRLRCGQLSSGFGYALEASKVRHCMRY